MSSLRPLACSRYPQNVRHRHLYLPPRCPRVVRAELSRGPGAALGLSGTGARLCPKGLESGMTAFLLSPQNVGGGTAVVQVRATDRDIGINSVLSYYITEGNEDMTFRMDRISGEIATRPAPPDRERQSFYHLVVTVEDEGTPTLSVSDGGWPRGEKGGGGAAPPSV